MDHLGGPNVITEVLKNGSEADEEIGVKWFVRGTWMAVVALKMEGGGPEPRSWKRQRS